MKKRSYLVIPALGLLAGLAFDCAEPCGEHRDRDNL